jgi:serine/threonine-protein kinase
MTTGAPSSGGAAPARAPSRERKGPGRLLPQRLGPYELFDHIGRGGMADIYRARREGELGVVRQVVVKEVLPELAGAERLAALLAQEAKLASRLEHANIVRVEQLGREDDTLYIAMEYVEGLDLRELLRRCARQSVPLPVELSLRIVIEILKGLDFAHRAKVKDEQGKERIGVIHRDVSPSNVLLSFEGEVKVCDFGIARAHDETAGAHAWSEAMIEGKAGYMSPEQARGEPLDPRADVFAAGIILWELVSGRKLYKARPNENLLDVAKRAVVPELPRRGMALEEELFVIVRRALARDRTSRYASAGAMLRDLESYAARSGMIASTLRLRRFLTEHFEPEVLAARARRELATLALAQGPLVVLDVVPSLVKETAKPAALATTGGGAPAKASASQPLAKSGRTLVWLACAVLITGLVAWMMARG